MRTTKLYAVLLALVLSMSGCASTEKKDEASDETSGKSPAVTEKADADKEVKSTAVTEKSDEDVKDSAATEKPDAKGTVQRWDIGDGSLFAKMNTIRFCFSSGAGAWSTELDVNSDGTFSGVYQDTDAGDTADEYPGGTVYRCSFTGKFKEPEKIDDLTYSTEIEYISYEQKDGTSEIKDKRKYMYTTPYGLEPSERFIFYLPGTSVSSLPQYLLSWINSSLYDYDTEQTAETLSFPAMYNESEGDGFSSYDLIERLKEQVASFKDSDSQVKNEMDSMKADLRNETAEAWYRNWDDCLNDIWSVLLRTKSEDEMQKLKTAEHKWIEEKEAAVKAAGAGQEDELTKSYLELLKGIEMTRERVCELIRLLE